MKAVIQRSKNARVEIEGEVVGEIEQGLVVLLGVTHEDTQEDINHLIKKIINLRIFSDSEGKMNLSLLDVGGDILSISQFTLYADTRKGRRPSYMDAAKPEHAEDMYERFNEALREAGVRTETGTFGAMMDVSLTNSGPVTLTLDSKQA